MEEIKVTQEYVHQLYKEYLEGKTINQVAIFAKVGYGTIIRWFRKENLQRRKDCISEKKLLIKHKRKKIKFNSIWMREYQVIYCKAWFLDKIPKSYEIHHIDFDPENNDIDNLEMLTEAKHKSLHAKARYTNE